jgi:hypothetical protein
MRNAGPIIIGTVLGVIGGIYVIKELREPRGIRNNNPGNIRHDGYTGWVGMTGVDEDGFIIFETAEYGIRAMIRIFRSYARRGVTTVADIVSTWAPETENNTAAYIDHVAQKLGLLSTDDVPTELYPELAEAIIIHENGKQPYAAATINRGVALA